MLMNNIEFCRESLYKRLGLDELQQRDSVAVAAETKRMIQKLEEVVKLAIPRLIMGGIRYGSDWEFKPLMNYMQTKLAGYKSTGNFELLIDLVNFVAIEGELKTHPKHHFKAMDREA